MGVGGVGSVTAEMLTRCGVGKVTLFTYIFKNIFVLTHSENLTYMYIHVLKRYRDALDNIRMQFLKSATKIVSLMTYSTPKLLRC